VGSKESFNLDSLIKINNEFNPSLQITSKGIIVQDNFSVGEKEYRFIAQTEPVDMSDSGDLKIRLDFNTAPLNEYSSKANDIEEMMGVHLKAHLKSFVKSLSDRYDPNKKLLDTAYALVVSLSESSPTGEDVEFYEERKSDIRQGLYRFVESEQDIKFFQGLMNELEKLYEDTESAARDNIETPDLEGGLELAFSVLGRAVLSLRKALVKSSSSIGKGKKVKSISLVAHQRSDEDKKRLSVYKTLVDRFLPKILPEISGLSKSVNVQGDTILIEFSPSLELSVFSNKKESYLKVSSRVKEISSRIASDHLKRNINS
jgi:hypothetical protein